MKTKLPGRSWLKESHRTLARMRCERQGHIVQAFRMKTGDGTEVLSYYCGRGCGVSVTLEYVDE